MSKKWMGTGYLKAKPAEVDNENGVLKRVKVCSAGPALGHGVHLEGEFIDTVVEQGNAASKGLKARFGHPNMCSEALGTFIGRFSNFEKGTTVRDDGEEAECCFADLTLSESAKNTPHGDLHAYILSMAENEADMFGTSIVFTVGKSYRRNTKTGEKAYRHVRESMYAIEVWYTGEDGSRLPKDDEDDLSEELFVECDKLHACDCVDEPAANDGLFSAFAADTVAGQITQFLDLHPQIFSLLEENQEILEAISQYGDKFDQFFSRYRDYRQRFKSEKEAVMSEKKEEKKKEVAEGTAAASGEESQKLFTQEEVEAEKKKAVEAALSEERERNEGIEELSERFGFADDARKFKKSGQSVEEFRAHILEKSPEQWQESLSIKNPSQQQTEQGLQSDMDGEAFVNQIKASRDAQAKQ